MTVVALGDVKCVAAVVVQKYSTKVTRVGAQTAEPASCWKRLTFVVR